MLKVRHRGEFSGLPQVPQLLRGHCHSASPGWQLFTRLPPPRDCEFLGAVNALFTTEFPRPNTVLGTYKVTVSVSICGLDNLHRISLFGKSVDSLEFTGSNKDIGWYPWSLPDQLKPRHPFPPMETPNPKPCKLPALKTSAQKTCEDNGV